MRTNNLLKPALVLIFLGILYTGCGTYEGKYIYLNPQAILFANSMIVPDMEPIPYQEIVIQVTIPTRNVRVSALTLPGNYAYATSIPHHPPTQIDSIRDILIRPVNNYNDGISAYQDMSEFCTFSMTNPKDTLSKQTLISYMQAELFTDQLNMFSVRLTKAPANSSTQQFIVELILDDNSKLADTTQAIILTN